MRFSDLTAVVTGGVSGIGKATVDQLEAEGARVAVIDIAEDAAADVHVLDISNLEQAEPTIARIVESLDHIDLLVNCAGWDLAQPFADTSIAFWERVVAINLLGPIAITHASLSHMPEGGSIVNVASDAGRVGSAGEVVYSGAKGGLIGFTKALARETASRGIRVNAVAPGPTDTNLLKSFDPTGKLAAAITRHTPLKKLATPEDVASAICFLGSREAAHITGQVLSVSGGLTML